MTKLLDFLAGTTVIWGLFILFILLGGGFYFAEQAAGGALLDMKMTAKEATALLAAMSEKQKQMHLVATLTLDTLYPLAYGGLLAGIAWRFGGKFRPFLVVPAFIAVITDFIENTVQAIALSGSEALLPVKDIITPVKYYSVSLAAIIALGLLLFSFFKWLLRKKN
jgi:hypothetical protein